MGRDKFITDNTPYYTTEHTFPSTMKHRGQKLGIHDRPATDSTLADVSVTAAPSYFNTNIQQNFI